MFDYISLVCFLNLYIIALYPLISIVSIIIFLHGVGSFLKMCVEGLISKLFSDDESIDHFTNDDPQKLLPAGREPKDKGPLGYVHHLKSSKWVPRPLHGWNWGEFDYPGLTKRVPGTNWFWYKYRD